MIRQAIPSNHAPLSMSLSPVAERLSPAPRFRRKVLRFAADQIHTFVSDRSPCEEDACWYSLIEYNDMRRNAVHTLRGNKRGLIVDSMLGLESRTREAQQEVYVRYHDTMTAVFLATTEEERRQAYQKAGAAQAAREAHVRAKLLAIEVQVEDRAFVVLRNHTNTEMNVTPRCNTLKIVSPTPKKATITKRLTSPRAQSASAITLLHTKARTSPIKKNKKVSRRHVLFLAAPVALKPSNHKCSSRSSVPMVCN